MNKIINESLLLLDQWRKIVEEQQNYENENWHCVNVKRYNDQINFNELIKSYTKPEQEFLKDHFLAPDGENIKDYIYYENFLSANGWEQLNYELSDIEEISKGMPYEHKKFIYLKDSYEWAKGKSILALGRSGGWACFQTTEENTAEEIESILDGITNEKREIVESDAGELENRLIDLEMYNKQLADAIEEVNYIKNYIEEFNRGLSFEEFLKDEIEFRLEEFREEEDGKKDNFTDFLAITGTNLKKIIDYMDQYITDKELKTAINRNIKSIKALINNKI